MLAMENIFEEQPIEVMIGEAPDATREHDDDDTPPVATRLPYNLWTHPMIFRKQIYHHLGALNMSNKCATALHAVHRAPEQVREMRRSRRRRQGTAHPRRRYPAISDRGGGPERRRKRLAAGQSA